MDLKNLKGNFNPQDVEWRVQRAGKKGEKAYAVVLPYITSRAIMERLDEVVGPENWRNEFQEWKGKGVKCGISIKIGGDWVTKYDGADDTNFESTKGGFSDSMKRAAVQWGIGRYLYNLDPAVVQISDQKGENFIKDKDKGIEGYWNNPRLPQWSMPTAQTKTTTTNASQAKTMTTSNASRTQATQTATNLNQAKKGSK